MTEFGHKLQELEELLKKFRFKNWEVGVGVLSAESGNLDPSAETIRAYEQLPGVRAR